MKKQLTQIKWISAALIALTVSTGAQAFDYNFRNYDFFKKVKLIPDYRFIPPLLNCVNVPELHELQFGSLSTAMRTTILSQGGAYTELTSNYNLTNVSDTHISANITKLTYPSIVPNSGGFSDITVEYGEITSTFSIAGGYKDITEETFSTQNGSYQDNHRYSDYLRKASGFICENKTWNSGYYHTSEIIRDYPISALFYESTINTIEAINIQKTVEAGTYTTYQHKVEYGSRTITNWVDIHSGILVASEVRNSSTNNLIAKKELIKMTALGIPPVYPPSMIKNKPAAPVLKGFKF